ncbi:hypothetical protein A2U01_0012540, partial [Trifolium medium]|nr:hypothetical protein [Trifolium medium]
MVSSSKAKR